MVVLQKRCCREEGKERLFIGAAWKNSTFRYTEKTIFEKLL